MQNPGELVIFTVVNRKKNPQQCVVKSCVVMLLEIVLL